VELNYTVKYSVQTKLRWNDSFTEKNQGAPMHVTICVEESKGLMLYYIEGGQAKYSPITGANICTPVPMHDYSSVSFSYNITIHIFVPASCSSMSDYYQMNVTNLASCKQHSQYYYIKLICMDGSQKVVFGFQTSAETMITLLFPRSQLCYQVA
jgi:hypothetical protein